MNPAVRPVAWTDVPEDALNPLLTRQFVHGEQAMLSRIQLKKGCIVPRHSHANEQIACLLSGTLSFSLGKEGAAPEDMKDVVLHSGEVLVIPGGLPHSVVALEDSLNLDIFAPPRQDWIDGDDAYLR